GERWKYNIIPVKVFSIK
ncbi:unnamed protein product, partial [Rotaria sp. Silwood1]